MISVDLLAKYMEAGLNILITGQAGTGKTTMIQDAAEQLGWNMKYYSTSTIDPFSELVGIPVPNHGRKTVDFFRPRELDSAKVVFFDELNRADLMVLNAVLEITQFRSVNGEPLRELQCVVAAVNPVESGYATRELDRALKDRYDIFLESDPNPSWEYFKKRFGEDYARAGFELFREHNERRLKGEPLDYFSPRRLDKLLTIFQKFPYADTVKSVVPSSIAINYQGWAAKLSENLGDLTTPVVSNLDEKIRIVMKALRTNYSNHVHAKEEILNTYHMAKIADHPSYHALRAEMAVSLNQVLASKEDLAYWNTVIKDFSDDEFATLIHGWPPGKAIAASQTAGHAI